MRVPSTTFLPLLVSAEDAQLGAEHVTDDFLPDLRVAYSFGPPYGEALVTWQDLESSGMTRRALRRTAEENLAQALERVEVHGQPPALMLSFSGMECSALLADEFWDAVEQSVPGELVVGVPARDVVIITGGDSQPGLARARRGVDRVFFAGDAHLLSRDLLVRRQGTWTALKEAAPAIPEKPRSVGIDEFEVPPHRLRTRRFPTSGQAP